jgi:N,N'-diacetyllegionaminate synthase
MIELSKNIKIGSNTICSSAPVYIIAEIGTNHCRGDMEIAKKMVLEAKRAGANAVKFQTFKADSLITRDAPQASRLDNILPSGKTWFDLLVSEELSYEKHKELLGYCIEQEITFLSTPYDNEGADFLCDELDIPALKIASADIVNHPLLEHCAKKMRPIIVSTGMSNLDDVENAIEVISGSGNKEIILLQCTAAYPTGLENVNLKVISLYREKFNCLVGYSDHSQSDLVPISAVSLGAKVYEKHFTLSTFLPGADHETSYDPDEFKKMVDDIRQLEIVLGSKHKEVLSCEAENQTKYRRSYVAVVDIEKDETVSDDMLGIKRPGTGILPRKDSEIIGLRAKCRINKDTILDISMLY